MNTKKFIQRQLRTYLNENYEPNNLVDFNTFPESIKKTLFDEYGDFESNFDWNKKQDELGDQFRDWFNKNSRVQFLKNLDNIIRKTSEDIETLKNLELVEKKLYTFEELIKPSISNDALTPALSKFAAFILLNRHTVEDIEKGFQEAKNIIDKDGNIDVTKTTPSEDFKGGDINLPDFERFVEKNPEFQGVFNDWKKLFDEHTELLTKDLHAFRNSTSLERIQELHDFLVNFKNERMN